MPGPEFVVLFDRIIRQNKDCDPDKNRNDRRNDQKRDKCTDDLYDKEGDPESYTSCLDESDPSKEKPENSPRIRSKPDMFSRE